ncbi:type II toxin-antitoxin system VapC family toxin [Rudanella lutea]|uniref:type II toxin-antitoxin system VapC family toxin n=1 Tax=Rudanella lutea TaxID=451374 RepID=UPI0003617A7E|nr:type II toxin-antitoxin system VapC family toxin [Rudanella lutea]
MRYLIDTNVLIILFEKSFSRLSDNQLRVLSDPANSFFVSEASLYEIAIKIRVGKKDFAHINYSGIQRARRQSKIKILRTNSTHYESIQQVSKVFKPDGKPHADPFDLLILAQAHSEQIPILSTDQYFPKYSHITVIA